MDIQELLDNIGDREDFIKFVHCLMEDLEQDSSSWANTSLEDYLFAIVRYVEDMDGIYTDEGDFDHTMKEIDWSFIAWVLFAASRYE